MNNVKKTIYLKILLLAILIFGLSGCGKNTIEQMTEQATEDMVIVEETTEKAADETEENVLGIYPKWAETTVFYEIFVRSFADSNGDGIGDFKGIEENLDYLEALGIGAIWLMPIMESTTYHGYDVVDYYSTNPDYGTMEEFDSLVNACHEKDIKIIIDLVVNHTSNENPWFKKALKDENSKYRNYYTIAETIPVSDIHPQYPYWRQDEETGLYYFAQFDSIMPDLNYHNQEVRDDIKNVAAFWLEHGIDGFRLDAAKEVDSDIEVTLDWWKEFTKHVASIKQDTFIVGENWTTEYTLVGRYYEAMPSSFNFSATEKILGMAEGKNVDMVADMNTMRKRYREKVEKSEVNAIMIDSVMIGNHDMDRAASRLGDIQKAKLAATIQFTLAGTPFIYYGEEIGQKGESPDDNRREPFDWYTIGNGKYMTRMTDIFFHSMLTYVQPEDGISVEEENSNPDSILNHYKKLIDMRNKHKAFYTGTYETLEKGDKGLYAYKVTDGENQYLVIHNQGAEDKIITLNVSGRDIYNEVEVTKGSVEIKAYSSLIMQYDSDVNPINEADFASVY